MDENENIGKTNYEELAREMMDTVGQLWKGKRRRKIDESMQGEKFALKYLLHRHHHALPNEISREMGISTARTAATLNSLERKGYIEREIDKNDRRRILVSLTNRGREHACQYHDAHMAALTEILRELGEDDAREFVRIIGRLGDIFEG